MNPLLLAPVLFIVVVLYVAWPLLKESPDPEEESDATELEVVTEAKDLVIANLKDLEMDYRMGKLAPEDYDRLRSGFEQETLELYSRLDALEKKKSPRRKKSS